MLQSNLGDRENDQDFEAGGCIVMQHFIYEGENAAYYGLHQWNFSLRNGDLFISNRDLTIVVNLAEKLRSACHLEARCVERRLFCTIPKL